MELELEELLHRYCKERQSIPSPAALWGVPSLGKTKYTLKDATLKYHSDYTNIFWVSAATDEKILESYQYIFASLEYLLAVRASEKHMTPAAVTQMLEGDRSPSWLLVLDNVTDGTVRILRTFLPKSNSRGNILFTSRTKAIARSFSDPDGIQYYREDRIDYSSYSLRAFDQFRSRAGMAAEMNLVDLERSLQVVRRLSSFPWAITQAANFIKQCNLTLEDVLFIINEESEFHVCELVFSPLTSDTKVSGCLRYLKALVSAKALSGHENDPVTATLASYSDQHSFSERTGNLIRLLSYIEKNGISSNTFVEGTHSLIFVPGMFTTISQEYEENRYVEYDAIGCTSGSHRPTMQNRSQDLVDVQDLFPSIEGFLTIAQGRKRSELDAKDLKTRSARANLEFLRFKRGHTEHSENEWSRALDNEKKNFGKKDPEAMLVATDLALIYQKQGNYRKAEKLAHQSRKARREQFGDEHPQTLLSANILASIFEKQGKIDDAEELYLQILVDSGKHAKDHLRTHLTVRSLALLCEKVGRLEESEAYCDRALRCIAILLGPQHPETLRSKAILASVYERQSKYDEAEDICKEVCKLTSAPNFAGERHPAFDLGQEILERIDAGRKKERAGGDEEKHEEKVEVKHEGQKHSHHFWRHIRDL